MINNASNADRLLLYYTSDRKIQILAREPGNPFMTDQRDILELRGRGRMFPVMLDDRGNKAWVPWGLVALHADQALRNHSQTVERLAERSGLAPCELAAVLGDRPWRRMDMKDAWREIFDAQAHALALRRIDQT